MQVFYRGIVHVPVPGAFPLAAEEGEGPHVEHGDKEQTLSGDRFYEHIHIGIIAVMTPVVVSPHIVPEELVFSETVLPTMICKEWLTEGYLGGGAGSPIAPGALKPEGVWPLSCAVLSVQLAC